ncbi:hypothetical protein [Pyrobaculum sp.]|uniref:hypothetical protein n=1 Tax=Pyrobaculum sp. TaxID=2004705 RepID=UPI003D13DAB8
MEPCGGPLWTESGGGRGVKIAAFCTACGRWIGAGGRTRGAPAASGWWMLRRRRS